MSKKILIIDDAPSVIELMEYWLKQDDYEVMVAQNGMIGFEKAKSENPDLIILDIMLPKIDGFNICRLLKFDKQYKNIPIVMVTAREQKEDKDLGHEVGADAYIEKPITQEVLLKTIKKLLKNNIRRNVPE